MDSSLYLTVQFCIGWVQLLDCIL